ncbi:MAG TPA: TAXI family TRAP transporter solute-binding subunit [Alphaproteobacteria bacterium]
MVGLSRRDIVKKGGILLALAGGVRPGRTQQARFFRIGAGPVESGNFAVGTLIGNLVSSPPGGRDCDRGGSCGVPGLIVITQTTAGAVANVDAVRTRRLESGLCQADIAYWAYHGTGLFKKEGAVQNLRAIANLYPEALHVVVRRPAGIREFRQLKGKVVSLGERESGTLVTARAVLQTLGVAERDLRAQFLSPAAAADAMRDGKLDAFFEMSGIPSAVVADLARSSEVDLLGIEGQSFQRLVGSHPFFTKSSIKAGTYHDVPEATTVSVGVLWIVDAEVDEKIVYGLTRALWHPNNRRILDSAAPYGPLIRLETAIEGVALPVHPGAALYYFEAGLIR